MAEARTVGHGSIPPVFDTHSRVLVLGTMPSPASLAAGFYYMHPRNRFWPVLGELFGEEVPPDPDGRRAFALRHGIALWDVLAQCEIVGAADASIRNPVPNDIGRILGAAPIRRVFTTGATAARLYRRWCASLCGVEAVPLPSTSPANCACPLERLVEAYRALLEDGEKSKTNPL